MGPNIFNVVVLLSLANLWVVRSALIHNSGGRSLWARQTGIPDVPPQCASSCDPVNTIIANLCTPSTCCTSDFDTAYFNCLECFGNATMITDFSSSQTVLDNLFILCAEAGSPIPKLTLPGQDPNRPLAAPSGSTPPSTISATPTSPATSLALSSIPISHSQSTIQESTTQNSPTTTPTAAPSPTSNRGTSSFDAARVGLGMAGYIFGSVVTVWSIT